MRMRLKPVPLTVKWLENALGSAVTLHRVTETLGQWGRNLEAIRLGNTSEGCGEFAGLDGASPTARTIEADFCAGADAALGAKDSGIKQSTGEDMEKCPSIMQKAFRQLGLQLANAIFYLAIGVLFFSLLVCYLFKLVPEEFKALLKDAVTLRNQLKDGLQ